MLFVFILLSKNKGIMSSRDVVFLWSSAMLVYLVIIANFSLY